MKPISDEQLRTHLARRSDDRLRADQRDALLSAVAANQSRQRTWTGRWPAVLAPLVAVVVLAVLLYPLLRPLAPGPSASPTGSQQVTPIPTERPTAAPLAGITIYTAQQLSDLIGDPAWINHVVLAEAEISPMLAPPPLRCETPASCEIAFLAGVSGKNVVSLSWRDAADGEGKLVDVGSDKRLMTPLAIPQGPGLLAFKILEGAPEYLGPVELNGEEIAWTVQQVQAGDHDKITDDVFVVDGWLVQTLPVSCPAPNDYGPGATTEYWCGGSFVTQEPMSVKSGDSYFLELPGLHVQGGAYQSFAPDPHFDPANGSEPRFGAYLVRSIDCPPAVMGDCPVWRMIGRLDGNPNAAPSPTPPPEPSSTPELTASPAPTPSPSLAPVLPGWSTLSWAQDAAWSPDSAHIAIMTGANTFVVDATGAFVIRFDGADDAVWIDSEHLLLRDLVGDPVANAPPPQQSAALYWATIGSGEIEIVGYDDGWAVSSGTGQVAFSSSVNPGRFRVLSGDGWTDARAGYPVAWTEAGDKLAILHERAARIGIEGVVEVLAWPSLESVASDTENVTGPTFAHFDPAGEHLGFMSYGSIHVLDFDSGHTSVVGPSDAWAWFGWDSEGHAVIGNERNFIGAYALDGTEVRHWEEMGDSLVSTPDGSAMLFFNTDYGGERPPMTLLANGDDPRTLDVSGTVDRNPLLAPDGHAVLLFAYVDNHQVVLLSQ